MRSTSIVRELKTIGTSLQSIQASLSRLAPAFDARSLALATEVKDRAPIARRKLTLSPARRAALRLQGQYMGYTRGLKPAQKKRVKALAASKGVAVAVKLARRLAQG